MNEIQIKEEILKNLQQVAPGSDVEGLGPDDDIRKTLDIDSFDHLNFLIALNTNLGVDIPEKDYGKLNTLHQIIDYITVRVA